MEREDIIIEESRKELRRYLSMAAVPDRDAMTRCQERWDGIAKPIGGLGEWERIYCRLAGIAGRTERLYGKSRILVLCADNGIVEEGVSQSDHKVTTAVAYSIAQGSANVNKMAAAAGAQVMAVDIGMKEDVKEPDMEQAKIRRGTRNFLKEPAMTEREALAALLTGIRLAVRCREEGCTVLGIGEMGIGNTTTSAALLSLLLGADASSTTGAGAGLPADGIIRKTEVVRRACALYQKDRGDTFRLLCDVGGLDIAGLAGVCLGGAVSSLPVVLDGVITAAAALTAERLLPGCKEFLFASHLGKEPACSMALERLSLRPVIDAGMALGEGTGAAMYLAMLRTVDAVYESGHTFEAVKVEPYQAYGRREGESECL